MLNSHCLTSHLLFSFLSVLTCLIFSVLSTITDYAETADIALFWMVNISRPLHQPATNQRPAGNISGDFFWRGVRCEDLECRLLLQVPGSLGPGQVHEETDLRDRPGGCDGLHHSSGCWEWRDGVSRLRSARDQISPDPTDASHWQTGRNLATAGLRGLPPQAGAHHHALHRLPRPPLLQLLHVPQREGRGGPGRQDRLLQLRGRAVVGRGRAGPSQSSHR